MINKCGFLNPVLNVCSETNQPCPYITDPHSCPNYDEESGIVYSKPLNQRRRSIEDELHKMGVETEKTEEIGQAPDWF